MTLLTPPGHLRGPPDPSLTYRRTTRPLTPSDPSQTFGVASRLLLDLREGLLTLSESSRGSLDHSLGLREGHPTLPGAPRGPPDSSRNFGRVTQPLSDLQEGLPTPPRPPGWPPGPSGKPPEPSQTSGRASRSLPDLREGLPDIQEGLPTPSGPQEGLPTPPGPQEGLSNHREGLPTPPGPLVRLPEPSGGPLDPSLTYGRASLLLPDLLEGLLTPPGTQERPPNPLRI